MWTEADILQGKKGGYVEILWNKKGNRVCIRHFLSNTIVSLLNWAWLTTVLLYGVLWEYTEHSSAWKVVNKYSLSTIVD